jgi:hypothetical protein
MHAGQHSVHEYWDIHTAAMYRDIDDLMHKTMGNKKQPMDLSHMGYHLSAYLCRKQMARQPGLVNPGDQGQQAPVGCRSAGRIVIRSSSRISKLQAEYASCQQL